MTTTKYEYKIRMKKLFDWLPYTKLDMLINFVILYQESQQNN